MNPTPGELREILRDTHSVAVVGASDNPFRPSNDVFDYLARHSRYDLYPVNPNVTEVNGVKTYPQVWSGVFAPKGIDPGALKALNAGFAKAAQSQAYKDAMLKAKLPVAYLDSKAFAAKIATDIKYFKAYKAKSGK